jgi:hypothetical protein
VWQRWFSPRALLLHTLLVVIDAGCLVAGWWQLHRALSGNELSWLYTFEWPIFAVIAVVGWWQLIHEDPAARKARKTKPPRWVDPTAPGGPGWRGDPTEPVPGPAPRRD